MGWIKNKRLPPITWGQVAPPVIFHKLYRPLGEIAFTFADMEEQVTEALTTMLGTSWREGAAMESLVQNFSTRIELFYFLALSLTGPKNYLAHMTRTEKESLTVQQKAELALKGSAKAIYADLQQANSDRNNLLHGAWTGLSVHEIAFSKHRVTARDGKLTEIPVREISAALLKDEARFIVSLRMRVADWTQRFRRRQTPDIWPPALPEKYLLRSPLGRLIQEHKRAVKPPRQPA
jgi:hypothetical protein